MSAGASLGARVTVRGERVPETRRNSGPGRAGVRPAKLSERTGFRTHCRALDAKGAREPPNSPYTPRPQQW